VNDCAADGALAVTPLNPALDAVVVENVAFVALEHDDVFLLGKLGQANRTSEVGPQKYATYDWLLMLPNRLKPSHI